MVLPARTRFSFNQNMYKASGNFIFTIKMNPWSIRSGGRFSCRYSGIATIFTTVRPKKIEILLRNEFYKLPAYKHFSVALVNRRQCRGNFRGRSKIIITLFYNLWTPKISAHICILAFVIPGNPILWRDADKRKSGEQILNHTGSCWSDSARIVSAHVGR